MRDNSNFAMLMSASPHSLQRCNTESSESKLISESDEVEDIVDKNRNL